MTSYQLQYLGSATVDKRLSSPMLPWIIAQIKRAGTVHQVRASLGKCCLELEGGVRLSHQLGIVARLGVYPEGEGGYLVYALRDRDQPLLYCHLLHSSDIHDVLELMASMKEMQSRVKTPTSLCPDISPSSSHFFEVLYIGRIKVSHKKVPETFIDEALDRFRLFERQRKEREQQEEGTTLVNGICRSASGPYASTEALQETEKSESEKLIGRKRSGSVGTVLIPDRKNDTQRQESLSSEHNRTMVFHVGRTDLRLISPDRKQVLLHKYLRDITHSLQGSKHSSHFAFVSKESTTDNNSNYVGYVFKCDSPSVAEDIVSEFSKKSQNSKVKVRGERKMLKGWAEPTVAEEPLNDREQVFPAINQAAVNEKKTAVVSCETCPMVWYHRLCTEIDAAGPSHAQDALRKRLDSLPHDELAIVRTKLEGGGSSDSIEIAMMLLRAHCEAKQSRHIHDTPETRHEFLSHYLGSNAIFLKAKRSLTSSFDQLLKRRGSRDDLHHSVSLPHNASLCKDLLIDSPNKSHSETDAAEEPGTPGSMINIFMKLGKPTPRTPTSEMRPRSWRQAIYNNVVTPSKALQKDAEKEKPRDRSYYRELWKKAINQQVLLIRMEKENAQLTAHQEEATLKRIKLEYEEVGSVGRSECWENILRNPSNSLLDALKIGIPKSRRGEIWMQLAEQFEEKHPSKIDLGEFPLFDVPYEQLLKQLTSHQHAILIDLGRTFPNHPYYSSPLGPGQLSLFNILKAYSLVDPEVGYCQGLSFTAGLLLLHMPEADAFYLLRHLMFSRGLRERYLPDMSALQVCLYQLSRLLHDLHPDLYDHFDSLDIAPSLYAAPWLLTLFSSQFSLGFVARIFDLIFVESPQVLFSVAIGLLGQHKQDLLACSSFEEVMDYLKVKLPYMSDSSMDSLINEVAEKDVSRELKDYGVEYHVLEEEMSSPRPEVKRIKELEIANQALADQVLALQRQLQMATSDIKRLESTRGDHVSQLNKAENELEEARREVKVVKGDLATVANFLAETMESSDLSLPNNVFRILKQYNINLLPKNKGELRAQVSCPELKPHSKPTPAPTGRILSESEKNALIRSRQAALERVKKPAQSALELVSSSRHHHPLDSDEVVTNFEGTVSLKSLPAPLRRAETVAQGLRRPEEIRRRSEDVAQRKWSEDSLRIIEPTDFVAAKIQSTKDKVSRLFDFDKPFGKQTAQMLIKSQALPKPNRLLT